MFEYTLDNHFLTGYDSDFSQISGFRKNQTQKWTIRYGRPTRKYYDWKTECILAAENICKSTEIIPNLLFSGGIDSEVMVRSFMANSYKFKITIMKFPRNLNLHDITYATEFCHENKLSYELIDVDPIWFWENELDEVAYASQSFSPQLCLGIYLASLVDGLPVIGNGNIHVTYHNNELCLEGGERWCCYNRYFVAKGLPAIPGFHQYSPEMVAAFMKIAGLQEFIKIKGHSKYTKFEIYKNAWGELKRRPKFTGYEALQDEDYVHRTRLIEKYGRYDEMDYIPLKELI